MLGLFLFFACFLYATIRIYIKKGITPSFFLYLLYTLSGFSSIILVLFFDYGKNPYIKDYNSGAIFLLIALLLFLYPFATIREDKINSVTIISNNIFKPIKYVLTFFSFFSILYFIPIAQKMIFVDISDIGSLRQMVAGGENPFIVESIFNTIAGTAASFYTLQLLFFFLHLVEEKKITKFSILVLASSLSYPIFVLAYLGRDGVLFWFFSFIMYYLLFRKCLPSKINKALKKTALILLIPFVAVFIVITIGRFVVDNNSESLFFPIASYLGQGPINFSELYYTDIKGLGYGKNVFPLFFDPTSENINFALEKYNMVGWVFKTFVASIYLDFGGLLTLVMAMIFILIFRCFYSVKKGNFSFSFLLLYTLFYTIYSQGVFYFRQYNRVGNLFIVLMLVFAFVSIFISKRKVFLDRTDKE